MVVMTPRARVRAVIWGEECDRVPFTIYQMLLPRGYVERRLRGEGLALVARIPTYRIHMSNVEVWTREAYEEGLLCRYKLLRTPVGEISSKQVWDPAYGSGWWTVEYPVKSRNDYRVMEFVVRDEVYLPNYEEILLTDARLGEDGYVRGKSRKAPMWRLMYELLGVERFALDMQDYPDEFFSLHDAMWEKDMEMFKVAVKAPVEMIRIGGNYHAAMIGPRLFQQYYLQHINRFCALAHEEGKLVHCHLDGKIGYMKDFIAESGLDVVEAFTPVPVCDMSVVEAREAWPEKILWMNFPSSVLTEPPEAVCQETLKILREAAPGDHFLVGITEDVPENAWRTSLTAISRTILEHGALPIEI